jgi:NADH dehydrogenase FAD-containing subunit
MLPQVISGMIESNHVMVPIRQGLKRTKFYEAEVTSIDVKEGRVILRVENKLSIRRVWMVEKIDRVSRI